MKRLFALLLVFSLCLGLVACTKPGDSGTNADSPTTAPTTPNRPANILPTIDYIPTTPHPYAGITLEIWGMGTEDDYNLANWDGKGDYRWMQRAAIEDWAALNEVTIKWMGTVSQHEFNPNIAPNRYADLIFHTNMYPYVANTGLVTGFTQAEYDKLAAIAGNEWLDMLTYGTDKVGFVLPWTSTMMVYYNYTLFNELGVMTPKQYFDEGNWNWTTFMYCMEEMTKDFDCDGETDIYGLSGESWRYLVNPLAQDENGYLISTIDEPWMQDYFQMKYDAYTVKKVTNGTKSSAVTTIGNSRYAMHIDACEAYDLEQLVQITSNGDIYMAVPVPQWVGADGAKLSPSQVTQACVSLSVTCDERAAAVDCLAYMLKYGLKYISESSLGAIKCDDSVVRGYCDYSSQWCKLFAEVCQARKAEIEQDRSDYDRETAEKRQYAFQQYCWNDSPTECLAAIDAYLKGCSRYIGGSYAQVAPLTNFNEIKQMPPESSIPAIKEKYQAQLDVYNITYLGKWS